MKTRLSLLLGLLIAVTPVSAAGQAESPPPESIDPELVARLCAATADDQGELDACIESVETALAGLAEQVPAEEQSLLERLAETVDGTLEDLREVDVEQAFDDVVQRASEFELEIDLEGAQEAVDQAISDAQRAIDELELPSEIDVQGALEDAVEQAMAATEDFDLGAAVDDAVATAQAAIDDAEIEARVDEAIMALEEAVADAEATVAEAQAWAQENSELVCGGGSLGLGATVGIVVLVITGWEWLGLQAFLATERLTGTVCDNVVGESE